MTYRWNRSPMGESLFSQDIRQNENRLVKYGKFVVNNGSRKLNRIVYFYKGEKVAKLDGEWCAVYGSVINDQAYFRF